jgi:hypothetical protein
MVSVRSMIFHRAMLIGMYEYVHETSLFMHEEAITISTDCFTISSLSPYHVYLYVPCNSHNKHQLFP